MSEIHNKINTCTFGAFHWVFSSRYLAVVRNILHLTYLMWHSQKAAYRIRRSLHVVHVNILHFVHANLSIIFSVHSSRRFLGDFVSHNSVYRTHARHILVHTDPFGKQAVSYFPSKHRGILALVIRDFINHRWSGDLRFTAADNARFDGTSLVIPTQDLADKAMRYSELSGNVTWSHSTLSQFHYPPSNDFRQWPPVDKHTSQLIHATMSCNIRCVKKITGEDFKIKKIIVLD